MAGVVSWVRPGGDRPGPGAAQGGDLLPSCPSAGGSANPSAPTGPAIRPTGRFAARSGPSRVTEITGAPRAGAAPRARRLVALCSRHGTRCAGARHSAARPAPPRAFFDLDKTIIAKSSTLAFSRPFQAGGLISRRAVLRSAYAQFVYLVGGADHDQMEKMREFMSRAVRRLGRRDGPRDRRRDPAQHRRPAGLRRGRLADRGAPRRPAATS